MEILALALTAYLVFQTVVTGAFKMAALTPGGRDVGIVAARQGVREQLGIPWWLWNFAGAWELGLGAVALMGLFVPAYAVAAGVLAAATMAVALYFHLRARDTPRGMAPAMLELTVALAVVALRAPEILGPGLAGLTG